MTFSDGCPCGRSQDLTFAESSEKFLVDRKTFDELLVLVGWCTKELIKSRHGDCDNFFAALDAYLSSDSPETSDSLETRESFLLLNYYRDSIPEAPSLTFGFAITLWNQYGAIDSIRICCH